MSKPFKPEDYDKDPGLQGALQTIGSEVTSAMSALNMEPEPIRNHGSQTGFLSETDAWAQHSMEHLHNICVWQREIQTKLGALEGAFFVAKEKGQMDDDTLDKLLAILRGPSPLDEEEEEITTHDRNPDSMKDWYANRASEKR